MLDEGMSFLGYLIKYVISEDYFQWDCVIYYLYCCTVHFEDSLNITHQQMH